MSAFSINPAPLMTNFLVNEVQMFSREPLVALDIGARGGYPAEWHAFKDQLRVYCFEPDEEECRRLSVEAPPNVVYIPTALGAASGPAALYEATLNFSTGLYQSRMDHFNRFLNRDNAITVGKSRVMVRTLDEVADEYGIGAVDFIKVDAEGAELDILRAGTRLLGGPSVLGILSELRFHEEINGSPPFASLDAFLRPYGFRLYDLQFNHHSRAALPYPGVQDYRLPSGERFYAYTVHGQIQDGDALYFRDLVIQPNAPLAGALSERSILKLCAMLEIYSLNDCAAELILAFRQKLESVVDCTKLLDLLSSGIAGKATTYDEYIKKYFNLSSMSLAGSDGNAAATAASSFTKPVRLSIITPATDQSRYIEEMLASVRANEIADVEHLIVYDGEPSFALKLAAEHPHLRIIDGGGIGPAYAMDRGTAAAHGEFILFLNSDDRLMPGALSRFSECATQSSEVAIWTGGTRIFQTDAGGKEMTRRVLDDRAVTALTLYNVLYDIPLLTARFVRRAVFGTVGGLDIAYPFGNDREFMLRCALSGIVEAPLGVRISELRMHDESITINENRGAVPQYLREHLTIADKALARADLTPDARATIRRWRAAEVSRLVYHQIRAGRPVGALRALARETLQDPTWWLRVPAALVKWTRRRGRD